LQQAHEPNSVLLETLELISNLHRWLFILNSLPSFSSRPSLSTFTIDPVVEPVRPLSALSRPPVELARLAVELVWLAADLACPLAEELEWLLGFLTAALTVPMRSRCLPL
jgi:hypothetical protein